MTEPPSYSQDYINGLVTTIESIGGAVLPEVCTSRKLKYEMKATSSVQLANTCGCGQETLVVLPYEASKGLSSKASKRSVGGTGFVRVCINCDLVGNWPSIKKQAE